MVVGSRAADTANAEDALGTAMAVDDAYARNWAVRMEIFEDERKTFESWDNRRGRGGVYWIERSARALELPGEWVVDLVFAAHVYERALSLL